MALPGDLVEVIRPAKPGLRVLEVRREHRAAARLHRVVQGDTLNVEVDGGECAFSAARIRIETERDALCAPIEVIKRLFADAVLQKLVSVGDVQIVA